MASAYLEGDAVFADFERCPVIDARWPSDKPITPEKLTLPGRVLEDQPGPNREVKVRWNDGEIRYMASDFLRREP